MKTLQYAMRMMLLGISLSALPQLKLYSNTAITSDPYTTDELIKLHFGKKLKTLCTENENFKQAWDETWWNVKTTCIKTVFADLTHEERAHMRANLEVLRNMSRTIAECIHYGEQALTNQNSTPYLRDSGNIGADILAGILLFPLALICNFAENRRTEELRKLLRISKEAQSELQERITALEKVIAVY